MIQVLSPFDGAFIESIPESNPEQVERALDAADYLFRRRDHWIPLQKRIEILEKAKSLLESRWEDLALQASREGGKPLIDSRVEAMRAIDSLRVCIETLRTQVGQVIPMNLNGASAMRLALTRHEPIGVVVGISAFNHPLNLVIHQIGPAIAAGCPIIIKPATETPLSCRSLVQMMHEAGCPPEWCQMVATADNSLAEKLACDPRVGFVSFIGSARVGWALRSKLAAGTRCSLEHGGIAPIILAADADWKAALPLIAKGGFYHAGQVCVSVQRVYVHESIAGEFTDGLAEIAKKLRIGDPTLPTTEVGPLIRPAEVDRVEKWVDEAIKNGARAFSGAKRISNSCYECTVLLNPPENIPISCNEVFGPVVCVYSFADLDEAIARSNATPYAFQAGIFTQNIDTAIRISQRLNASAVMINDHTAFRVDWMPFAGLKHSGLGIGGIPYTLRDMQIEKMIILKSKEVFQ